MAYLAFFSDWSFCFPDHNYGKKHRKQELKAGKSVCIQVTFLIKSSWFSCFCCFASADLWLLYSFCCQNTDSKRDDVQYLILYHLLLTLHHSRWQEHHYLPGITSMNFSTLVLLSQGNGKGIKLWSECTKPLCRSGPNTGMLFVFLKLLRDLFWYADNKHWSGQKC